MTPYPPEVGVGGVWSLLPSIRKQDITARSKHPGWLGKLSCMGVQGFDVLFGILQIQIPPALAPVTDEDELVVCREGWLNSRLILASSNLNIPRQSVPVVFKK